MEPRHLCKALETELAIVREAFYSCAGTFDELSWFGPVFDFFSSAWRPVVFLVDAPGAGRSL